MRNLLAAVAASAALLFAPSAEAVTVDGSDSAQGTINISDSGPASDHSVVFDWSSTPVEAWYNFTSATAFDLFFTAYEASSLGSNDRSAVYVQELTGPAGDSGDQSAATVVSTLTTANAGATITTNSPLVFSGVQATIITGAGGQAAAIKPDAATPLFADLAAGSYRIGIFDNLTPQSAQASFRISAIPLPPAALGLLAAFGLAAAVRRVGRAA
ncbi:MAG: hypothetical protein AAF192_05955 [Pseudomonadota bacterium]